MCGGEEMNWPFFHQIDEFIGGFGLVSLILGYEFWQTERKERKERNHDPFHGGDGKPIDPSHLLGEYEFGENGAVRKRTIR